jgi:hypothetical protein
VTMEPGSEQQAADLADDGGRALHARLLRGDPTAPSDLAKIYLDPLATWLHQTFPRDDDAMLESIAIDLMLSLAEHPERYDPDKLSLSSYLRMAARGDVKNERDSARRRAAHHAPLEDVELRPPARNSRWANASDLAGRVADALDDERLAAVFEHFAGQEREVVELMVDGERRNDVFAEVLGLKAWPRDTRDREVKRVKDRVKKRMQRIWRKLYGDG